MADNKNDPQTPKADESKISAGSSLGTPGTPPKPPGMTAGSGSPAGGSLGGSPAMGSTASTATGTGMGSSTAGSTGTNSMGSTGMGQGGPGGGGAQSSTLASHTSKPLGGGAGPTGAGLNAGQGHAAQAGQTGSEFKRHQDHSAQPDQARETAEQIRERASDMYESASDWARDKYEAASSWASDHGGSRVSGSRGASSIHRFANENPMLVGVVGLAAGLLLGALLPRTRPEDRTFGEWSDEVRQQGLRYASEAVHRGREYAEQAFQGDDPAHARHESDFRRTGSGRDDEAAQAARVSSPIAGQYRNH